MQDPSKASTRSHTATIHPADQFGGYDPINSVWTLCTTTLHLLRSQNYADAQIAANKAQEQWKNAMESGLDRS